MATIFKRRRKVVDPKTGNKVVRTAKSYTAQYTDANGNVCRVPAYTDKQRSQALANQLETDAQACKTVKGLRMPLKEHLEAFRRHLEAKKRSEKHVAQTCTRIEAILDGCEFVLLKDVDVSAVEAWLDEQRSENSDDFGIKTSNYYTQAIRQFFNWMVKTRRAATNPVVSLEPLNPETDIRRVRRVLSGDEFQRLLKATEAGEPFRRISGPDRAMLYLLCSQTGLRAQEAASLTAASFNLDSVPSTITVEAGYSKRRRKDTIPLRAELAELLCEWLRCRDGLFWPGSWWNIAAQMVEQDLEAARDAWIDEAKDDRKERQKREQSDTLKYQDDAGCYFDFHALRHQFISELVEAGVHPKVAQELARHSTIVLTMDRYAHVETKRKSEALAKLPPLPEIQASNRRSVSDLTHNLTQRNGTSWQETAGDARTADSADAQEETPKPLDDSDLGVTCHALAWDDKEAPPGFEPGMADLQSAARFAKLL